MATGKPKRSPTKARTPGARGRKPGASRASGSRAGGRASAGKVRRQVYAGDVAELAGIFSVSEEMIGRWLTEGGPPAVRGRGFPLLRWSRWIFDEGHACATSQAELARVFRVPVRRVQRWITLGAPRFEPGRGYCLRDFREWVSAHCAPDEDDDEARGLGRAKRRYMAARAARAELDVRDLRRAFVRADQAAAVVDGLAVEMDRLLEESGIELGRRLAGKTPAQARRICEDHFNEQRRGLAASLRARAATCEVLQ